MADPKPIQQHIKVDADVSGAVEVSKALDQVERETKETTAATKEATQAGQESVRGERERAASIDKLSSALNRNQKEQAESNTQVKSGSSALQKFDVDAKLTSGTVGVFRAGVSALKTTVIGLIAGMIGSQGLSSAMRIVQESIQATNEKLREQIDLTERATKATLDLHSLSLKFNDDDEQFLSRQQEISGRGRAELAPQFVQFKSSTSGFLPPEQQREAFEQLVTVPSLGTGGGTQAYAEFAARASAVVKDPVALRNLQVLAINAAGEGDPQQFLRYSAELLPTGQVAGLSPEDTLGLLAVASRSYQASIAKTKLEQLMLRIQVDPQVFKDLEKVGVTPEQDFFQRLETLRNSGATKADLTRIANAENVGLLQELLRREAEVNQARTDLGVYDDQGVDVYSDFLNDLYTKNRRARDVQIGQQQGQTTTARNETDERAARIRAVRRSLEDIFDRLQREGRIDQRSVKNRLTRFDEIVALGHDPLVAARYTEGPGIQIEGRGIISGTAATFGTSQFEGIDEEVARRYAIGVQGPDGRFYGSLPGAEDLPELPIYSKGQASVDNVLNSGETLRLPNGQSITQDEFERRVRETRRIIKEQAVDTPPPSGLSIDGEAPGGAVSRGSLLPAPAEQVEVSRVLGILEGQGAASTGDGVAALKQSIDALVSELRRQSSVSEGGQGSDPFGYLDKPTGTTINYYGNPIFHGSDPATSDLHLGLPE